MLLCVVTEGCDEESDFFLCSSRKCQISQLYIKATEWIDFVLQSKNIHEYAVLLESIKTLKDCNQGLSSMETDMLAHSQSLKIIFFSKTLPEKYTHPCACLAIIIVYKPAV